MWKMTFNVHGFTGVTKFNTGKKQTNKQYNTSPYKQWIQGRRACEVPLSLKLQYLVRNHLVMSNC